MGGHSQISRNEISFLKIKKKKCIKEQFLEDLHYL